MANEPKTLKGTLPGLFVLERYRRIVHPTEHGRSGIDTIEAEYWINGNVMVIELSRMMRWFTPVFKVVARSKSPSVAAMVWDDEACPDSKALWEDLIRKMSEEARSRREDWRKEAVSALQQ